MQKLFINSCVAVCLLFISFFALFACARPGMSMHTQSKFKSAESIGDPKALEIAERVSNRLESQNYSYNLQVIQKLGGKTKEMVSAKVFQVKAPYKHRLEVSRFNETPAKLLLIKDGTNVFEYIEKLKSWFAYRQPPPKEPVLIYVLSLPNAAMNGCAFGTSTVPWLGETEQRALFFKQISRGSYKGTIELEGQSVDVVDSLNSQYKVSQLGDILEWSSVQDDITRIRRFSEHSTKAVSSEHFMFKVPKQAQFAEHLNASLPNSYGGLTREEASSLRQLAYSY